MASALVCWACVKVEEVELVSREYMYVGVRKGNHSNRVVTGRQTQPLS